jgi:hypothetical protein
LLFLFLLLLFFAPGVWAALRVEIVENISTYDFNKRSLTILPLEGENFASGIGAELKTKFSVIA